jgi:hypothetical protein
MKYIIPVPVCVRALETGRKASLLQAFLSCFHAEIFLWLQTLVLSFFIYWTEAHFA